MRISSPLTILMSRFVNCRTQLLSQAVTQVALTISMYRLYLLIIDIGRRKVTKITTTAMAMAMTTPTTTTTPMLLKVGPCCCWPCLPFPNLQLNDANLSWLRIIVLQFPIVQVYIIFLSRHNSFLMLKFHSHINSNQ